MLKLEYEAYIPMAILTMGQIREEIYKNYEGIKHVLIWHRIGEVKMKEVSCKDLRWKETIAEFSACLSDV